MNFKSLKKSQRQRIILGVVLAIALVSIFTFGATYSQYLKTMVFPLPILFPIFTDPLTIPDATIYSANETNPPARPLPESQPTDSTPLNPPPPPLPTSLSEEELYDIYGIIPGT